MPRSVFLWTLLFAGFPTTALGGPAAPVLNEISAMGVRSYLDEDGEQEDWIEIKNPTGSPISLLGWSLSDRESNPKKWVFPEVAVPAQGFLVVFASQKDRRPANGPLHTNFGLGSEGEFLGLFDPDGVLVDAFTPEFPLQRDGYSFGVHPETGELLHFPTPTPGAENDPTGAVSEFLEARVAFDPPRGVYEGMGPFEVRLSVDDPSATIRYTTDFTTPGWENGQTYTSPIPVASNATIRAVALKEGLGPAWVDTHTYFLTLTDQQKSLPLMAVTTDPQNLDGPEGIRHPSNLQGRGRRWERPVSMEYFDLEKGAAFQINSGMRLHGQLGRTGTSKKPWRLYFREDYGDPELDFLPIPGTEGRTFKRIVLRGGVQDTNPFVHDELARRTYGNMGQATSRGTFVSFFLNGFHWLHYNPTERYDEYFLDEYHGGGLDWDIVRHSGLAAGDLTVWNQLLALVRTADLTDNANYREVARRLDVANFADYLLLNAFAGTEDWPSNNWTAARLRAPGARFRFYVWDAEQSFARANASFHNTFDQQLEVLDVPIAEIYRGLKVNPDFQRVTAARFREHFYEGGGLTDDRIMNLFLKLRYTIRGVLPFMTTRIPNFWIPGRRYNLERHLDEKGFLEFIDIPSFGAPAPEELPPLEDPLPKSSPDLVADGWIDVQDLLEFKRQAAQPDSPRGFARRSVLDDDWERWDYSVGLGDLSLVCSDFDGDGSLDLACVNNEYGTLSVYLNNGKGGFLPPVQSPGPIGAEALAVADLDSDGLPDLVVANRIMLQQSLHTFRNEGGGVFSPIMALPINRTEEKKFIFARTVVLKDLNGDGLPDAVVQHESSVKNADGRGAPESVVGVYENLGGGILAHAADLPGGSAELMSRQCLLVEDCDGDLDLDIVVSDGDLSLLSFENLGGFRFGAPRRISLGGAPRTYALAALDLNDDGALDILASSRSNATINALVNDGQGNFALDNAYRVTAGIPDTVWVDDFNSDGHPDLLITNISPIFLAPKGSVDLLLNDGTGRFSVANTLFPAAFDPMPRSMASGDFDGDGDADFATLDRYNGVLSVFLNQQTPTQTTADVNSDSRIDLLDALEIQVRWGTEISGP